MTKRIVFLFLSVMWMSLIFYFSSQTADISGASSGGIALKIIKLFVDSPSPELVGIFETIIRKIAHFTEYAVLAILLYQTMRSFNISTNKAFLSVIIAIVYAITDEVHQHFVPGRACRVYDMFIDSFGSLSGYYISKAFYVFKSKKYH